MSQPIYDTKDHDRKQDYCGAGAASFVTYEAFADKRIGWRCVIQQLGIAVDEKESWDNLEDRITKAKPLQGKNILDYGCGEGKFSRFLEDCGATVIGVDIEKEMIAFATNKERDSHGKNQYFHIASGDLSCLGGASCIDFAIMNFVLCTIKEENEITKVLRAINNVLNKSGRIVTLNGHWEKSQGKNFSTFTLIQKRPTGELISGEQLSVDLFNIDPKRNKKLAQRVSEYFHSERDYGRFFRSAGLVQTKASEPTVPASDKDLRWQDEHTSPPFLILNAEECCDIVEYQPK